MAKYRIAWMPGDGVGHDVMEAARLVLDRMKLDAEYVPCDIGWEFWCKEGNALPDRTVKALKETTCGLFGAITSKPQSEAKEELAPELKDKGLVYFSPIVGLRQMFNLHTNMRPCKSYPGNPLNYRGNKITNPSAEDVPIDQVVFRENTEGMYGGVEFFSLPEPVYTALCANPKMKKWKDKARLENIALSTRDRKSTRLNSSHGYISYAVFCLKKKKRTQPHTTPLARELVVHPPVFRWADVPQSLPRGPQLALLLWNQTESTPIKSRL